MRRHEVELIANAVIDRVERSQPAEDDAFIELKRDWPPDFADAARRIAAHANAARGGEIIWLIGVDEGAHAVHGASATEPAEWFDQVRAQFENGWAPSVQIVAVPRKEGVVVAFVFDTSGAPFVVKSGAKLEVPWRGSTQTRSARRSELLQILVPRTHVPEVEIRRGLLRLREVEHDEVENQELDLELNVYITPTNDGTIVLPFHKMKAALFANDGTETFQFQQCSGDTDIDLARVGEARPRRPAHVEASSSEISVYGPGRATLRATGYGSYVDVESIGKSCEIRFQVRTAIGDVPVTLRQHFSRMGQGETREEYEWRATWRANLLPRPSGL